MVSWADRIAYVCHDFEDAVAAGIVSADMLPAIVRSAAGATESSSSARSSSAMVDAAAATGGSA